MYINHNSCDVFIRPGFDALHDGKFTMRVHHAGIANTAASSKLRLGGRFENQSGDGLEDSVLITPDWKQGSPFRRLFELAGCFPERNEAVDLAALLGKTFVFTIKMNAKNGKEYPNVIEVELPSENK